MGTRTHSQRKGFSRGEVIRLTYWPSDEAFALKFRGLGKDFEKRLRDATNELGISVGENGTIGVARSTGLNSLTCFEIWHKGKREVLVLPTSCFTLVQGTSLEAGDHVRLVRRADETMFGDNRTKAASKSRRADDPAFAMNTLIRGYNLRVSHFDGTEGFVTDVDLHTSIVDVKFDVPDREDPNDRGTEISLHALCVARVVPPIERIL